MNQSQKNAIEAFKRKAVSMFQQNIVDIIIYGSVAREESHADSDIDVVVIVKHKAFVHQMKLAAIAFDILLETGEYISVQTVKEEDFNWDTLFLHNVREDGIHVL